MISVSVVIPVYNAASYIGRMIDSVLNQGDLLLEIIAVNDGSQDDSGGILDDYARRHRNIKVIHQPNAGVSAARNVGMDLAQGEYLFFADADDWLEPNALSALYEEGAKCDADVVMSDFFQERSGKTIPKRLFDNAFVAHSEDTIEVIQRSVVYCQATNFSSEAFDRVLSFGGACWHHLIKRTLLREGNIRFNSALDGMLEDGYLLLHVFEKARCVAYSHIALYHYCINSDSSTHRMLPDCQERFGRALDCLEAYGKSQSKGEGYRQALFMRQLYFVNKACDTYFAHPDNPRDWFTRFHDFCDYLKTKRVEEAVSEVDVSLMGSRNARIQALLLKWHLWRLYFFLKTCKGKK